MTNIFTLLNDALAIEEDINRKNYLQAILDGCAEDHWRLPVDVPGDCEAL